MRRISVVGLLGVLVVGSAAWVGGSAEPAYAAGPNTSAPASWFVRMDGATMGGVASTSQSQTSTSVEQTIVFAPMSMSSTFWDWVIRSVAGQDLRKDVRMVGMGMDGKSGVITQQLNGAAVRSVVLPALNAADRSAAKVSVTMVAPSVQAITPEVARSVPPPRATLVASNFRVSIDGMPTSRVASVNAITITLTPGSPAPSTPPAVAARAGAIRTIAAPPSLAGAVPMKVKSEQSATVAVTPLVLGIAASDAPAFQTWLSSGAAKKTGSIDYLDPSLRGSLLKLSLSGLTVTRVATDTASGRATIELSVDGATLAQ